MNFLNQAIISGVWIAKANCDYDSITILDSLIIVAGVIGLFASQYVWAFFFSPEEGPFQCNRIRLLKGSRFLSFLTSRIDAWFVDVHLSKPKDRLKFSNALYESVIYAIFNMLNIYNLYDQGFSLDNIFAWCAQQFTLSPFLRVTYIFRLIHAIHSFFVLLIYQRNIMDFYVFLAHHTMQLILIVMSMIMLQTRLGLLLFFLHDPSDTFLQQGKCHNYFEDAARKFKTIQNYSFVKKNASYIYFFFFVLSWIVLRLIALPMVLFKIVGRALIHFYDNTEVENGVAIHRLCLGYEYVSMFFVLILILVILHFIWFYFIVKMIGKMALKKEHLEDIREEEESEKSNEAPCKAVKTGVQGLKAKNQKKMD